MEATFDNIEVFKTIIGVIKQITEDAEFYFTKESFEIQAVDMSSICLLDLYLSKKSFNVYNVDNDFTIGLNLKNFDRILNMGKKDNQLGLNCTAEADQLNIDIKDSKRSINFNLNLMDIDQERLEPHEIDYTNIIVMDSKEFETVVKDLLSVGDECTIKTNGETIQFEVFGDTGNGVFTIEEAEIKKMEPVSMKVNTKYLSYFAKCSKLSESVEIKLLNEATPLCITYKFGDNDYIRFYQATLENENE